MIAANSSLVIFLSGAKQSSPIPEIIFFFASSRIISFAQQSLISRKVSYLIPFPLFAPPSIGVGASAPPGKTAPIPPPPPPPPEPP